MNGPNPPNFFPRMFSCLEGNPNKYRIGPGDLTIRNETKVVQNVERISVTGNDPRYGTQSVPDTITTSICKCVK